ncbi:hypothetical protein INQ41_04755 [Lysobacter ciconiae]|uniref:YscD cytoplasmic domain-containing protein n=1 Tax=Novilysobacter ciconiae TaxID=2781022 RepID=A0A7S6UHI7_9GAMM|nr:FHA domain-containing protein [Lysobacter ciconiae]QOW20340.1 hypothetical protein INQ41_04755 [Lysobacter ciconiae]
MIDDIVPDPEQASATSESAPQSAAAAGADEKSATAQPTTARLVLRILAGLHIGANRVLGDQEMLLVGSGEDCDIVLSDDGVAPHHAMLLRNGNSLALRAIDAPAGFAGDPLYPGDPIELQLGAPVRLGDASFAVGDASDPKWMPADGLDAIEQAPLNARRAVRPGLAKTLAGLAVLSLVSAGIYASVRPVTAPEPSMEEQVAALVSTYNIGDNTTSINDAGMTVLTGTVPDSATRSRIQREVDASELPLRLNLRTGEDVAADVAEVLRSQGITARTRYLGNGDVEVSGRFEDQDKLRAAATSRAMIDVTGINRVIPRNYADEDAKAPQRAKAPVERTRIVSIVGGDDSYVLAADGTRYAVGAELPDDRGTLVAIGKSAWALVDGKVHQVKPDPPVEVEEPTAEVASNSEESRPSAAVARQFVAANPRTNRM